MSSTQQLDFFNTINIGGYELQESIKAVKKQNSRIYEILKQVGKPMTPLQVYRVYISIYGNQTPESSIRRAMTTLTSKGQLRKLDKQKDEQYGAKNYYWEAIK